MDCDGDFVTSVTFALRLGKEEEKRKAKAAEQSTAAAQTKLRKRPLPMTLRDGTIVLVTIGGACMTFTRRRFLALAALLAGCTGARQRVVLYCAQDREFAVDLLDDFRKEAGIEVAPKFDTEANKSVSLYQEIVAEKSRPRCDVFWNNEILATIRLERQGALTSYSSNSAKSYPGWAKASDHTWHAFASRARVLIVNQKRVSEKDRPRSILELSDPKWRNKVVMARPMFGTTATQMACLFEVLGSDRVKAYLTALKENGVQLAPGNKQVAEWVAHGKTATGKPVAVGVTDTDDAIIEERAGRDVAIVFPDQEPKENRMGTLFIPNTLCIPKGCPNLDGAKALVDYLLSAEVERRLAEGPSAQIPLNPDVSAEMPASFKKPAQLSVMQVDWGKAAEVWEETQAFVTKLFAAG
jgi:iron(III) transport system substrate-binding protein